MNYQKLWRDSQILLLRQSFSMQCEYFADFKTIFQLFALLPVVNLISRKTASFWLVCDLLRSISQVPTCIRAGRRPILTSDPEIIVTSAAQSQSTQAARPEIQILAVISVTSDVAEHARCDDTRRRRFVDNLRREPNLARFSRDVAGQQIERLRRLVRHESVLIITVIRPMSSYRITKHHIRQPKSTLHLSWECLQSCMRHHIHGVILVGFVRQIYFFFLLECVVQYPHIFRLQNMKNSTKNNQYKKYDLFISA